MSDESTRQSDWIAPPLADASGKGQGACLAVSASASYVDLTTLPGLPSNWPQPNNVEQPNALGHYVTITSESTDCYVVFGAAVAHVSGANAPAPATTNTVTSGAITTAVGVCEIVPAGTSRNYKLWLGPTASGGGKGQSSPCRYMGFVGAGTGKLRIWLSSP